MAVKPICLWPSKHLNKVCVPVADDEPLGELIADLTDTMRNAKGAGIAAPQIGVNKRLFIIEAGLDGQLLVAVNPIVMPSVFKVNSREGCLSIPGQRMELKRWGRVQLRFQDAHRRPQEINADGFLAIAIQHEIDHLNGIVIANRVSKLKREIVRAKLRKIQKSIGRN